jgi:hypothetical protein
VPVRQDIRLSPDEDKIKVYEQVEALFCQGKRVQVKEHRSGFPAVTVDCEEIHVLTDIISLEQWAHKWKALKELADSLGIKIE